MLAYSAFFKGEITEYIRQAKNVPEGLNQIILRMVEDLIETRGYISFRGLGILSLICTHHDSPHVSPTKMKHLCLLFTFNMCNATFL